MNRLDFLKSLSIAVLAPSVFIIDKNGEENELRVNDSSNERWPIYPTLGNYSYQYGKHVVYVFFTFVKINRNGVEYLIPTKEVVLGNKKLAHKKIIMISERIKKEFIVPDNPEFYLEKGFLIKYNKLIHNNYGKL